MAPTTKGPSALNIGRCGVSLAPLESSGFPLSNGARLTPLRPILRALRPFVVGAKSRPKPRKAPKMPATQIPAIIFWG